LTDVFHEMLVTNYQPMPGKNLEVRNTIHTPVHNGARLSQHDDSS